jgi:hypothetical protein
MKNLLKTLVLLTTLAGIALSPAFAHEGKKVAGPNGGRILKSVTPHVEFFVTKDRKVQFTFLDAANQPVAPAGQSVTVTTGNRAKPTVLAFSRQGNALVSDAALPAGNNLPAVIELVTVPGATPVVEKLNLNLSTCGECKHAEYACTCGH